MSESTLIFKKLGPWSRYRVAVGQVKGGRCSGSVALTMLEDDWNCLGIYGKHVAMYHHVSGFPYMMDAQNG